jgi:hypothetical protein
MPWLLAQRSSFSNLQSPKPFYMVVLGLGMDRASPRAERGSKLVGLVSRIVYGLRIQEDRVGLDWPIKGLGQVDASFNARGSGPRIPNGSSQSRTGDVRALDDREGAETGAALPQRHRRSALVPLRSPPPLGVAPRRLPRPRAEKAKIRSPPPRAEKAKIRLRWARSVPVRRRRQGSAHRAGSRRRSRRRRRRQGGVRRAGSRQARLQAVSSFLHLPPSPLPLSPFLSISLEFLFLGGPRQAGNGDRDRDRRHQRR